MEIDQQCDAASVSSFSAARRIKTLNDVSAASELLMLLNVDKGAPKASINPVDVANDFIAKVMIT